MATQLYKKYCGNCGLKTTHMREVPDRNLGCMDMLLGIGTLGLYFVVIFLTRYASTLFVGWHCTSCGS